MLRPPDVLSRALYLSPFLVCFSTKSCSLGTRLNRTTLLTPTNQPTRGNRHKGRERQLRAGTKGGHGSFALHGETTAKLPKTTQRARYGKQHKDIMYVGLEKVYLEQV